MAFVAIIALYVSLGILAAAGTIAISGRLFAGVGEWVFYSLLLILIAVFYPVFSVYFTNPASWPTKLVAAAGFGLLGLLGLRFAGALVAGYLLHGLWDLLHEAWAVAGVGIGLPLTEIPLAYGFLCLAYDCSIATYILRCR
ncbi:hypothetical protein [Microbulbifer sp. JSM ZJ756]|uniref:hypothetical protein n=1 Tax=Microbulbifer sp. JSM ZJ756 TaxID=3376191 RepID=UPI0037A1F476